MKERLLSGRLQRLSASVADRTFMPQLIKALPQDGGLQRLSASVADRTIRLPERAKVITKASSAPIGFSR